MNRKHDLRTKHIPNTIKRRVESESDNHLEHCHLHHAPNGCPILTQPIMNDEADGINF